MRLTRTGFTLAELLMSIAIAGVVAAAATATLVRQQRLYAAAAEILDVRGQLRDAADVLAADIRGAAVAGYGMPLTTDSAIEMFTTIGTSIACTAPAGVSIGLAPSVLANGNTLTSLLVTPDTGDLAAIYTIPAGNPDSARWETRRIISFASRALGSTCPASTGFTSLADASAGATGYQTVLAGPLVNFARKGAPIRFLRRARYSLYRSSDNLWYLGYRRCSVTAGAGCTTIQPLSGPYRPYGARGNQSGLSFRYFNIDGVEIPSGASAGASVARVDVILRGQSTRALSLTGDSRQSFGDSIVVSVSPRNRLQ